MAAYRPSHSTATIANSSIPIMKSIPSHTTGAFSFRASVTHDECTADVISEVQTKNHTASGSTAKDQSAPNDDPCEVIAAVNSTAATIQITKSDARSTAFDGTSRCATRSGMQAAPKASTAAIKRPRAAIPDTSEQDVSQKKVRVGAAIQGPVLLIDDDSLQSTSDVDRAASPEVPNGSTLSALDFLRWQCTPFTLERIGESEDHWYCPRLMVSPGSELSQILPPACYPLDSAVLLIHNYWSLGKSMPCKAKSVLIMYDELHQLDFSAMNITLLDPKKFGSSDHPLTEQEAFHERLGGWIDFLMLGQEIEIPHVYVGPWHIQTVLVDYAQLSMSLSLSNSSTQSVYPLPSGSDAPKRRESALQRDRDFRIDSTISLLKRGTLEDIIFCLCWMNDECNSEDICIVIKRRNKDHHLEPRHIDRISCLVLQNHPYYHEEFSVTIAYIGGLSKEKKEQRKKKFRKDLIGSTEMVYGLVL